MAVSFNMMLTDDNNDKLEKLRLAYAVKHQCTLTRMEFCNIIMKMVFKNYTTGNLVDKVYHITHPPKNSNAIIPKSIHAPAGTKPTSN